MWNFIKCLFGLHDWDIFPITRWKLWISTLPCNISQVGCTRCDKRIGSPFLSEKCDGGLMVFSEKKSSEEDL